MKYRAVIFHTQTHTGTKTSTFAFGKTKAEALRNVSETIGGSKAYMYVPSIDIIFVKNDMPVGREMEPCGVIYKEPRR